MLILEISNQGGLYHSRFIQKSLVGRYVFYNTYQDILAVSEAELIVPADWLYSFDCYECSKYKILQEYKRLNELSSQHITHFYIPLSSKGYQCRKLVNITNFQLFGIFGHSSRFDLEYTICFTFSY